jgi:hypothetical protein
MGGCRREFGALDEFCGIIAPIQVINELRAMILYFSFREISATCIGIF